VLRNNNNNNNKRLNNRTKSMKVFGRFGQMAAHAADRKDRQKPAAQSKCSRNTVSGAKGGSSGHHRSKSPLSLRRFQIDRVRTAMEYDSEDSGDDIWEERSRYSRYCVFNDQNVGEEVDDRHKSDEVDRYANTAPGIDPLWSMSMDSFPPVWRPRSEEESRRKTYNEVENGRSVESNIPCQQPTKIPKREEVSVPKTNAETKQKAKSRIIKPNKYNLSERRVLEARSTGKLKEIESEVKRESETDAKKKTKVKEAFNEIESQNDVKDKQLVNKSEGSSMRYTISNRAEEEVKCAEVAIKLQASQSTATGSDGYGSDDSQLVLEAVETVYEDDDDDSRSDPDTSRNGNHPSTKTRKVGRSSDTPNSKITKKKRQSAKRSLAMIDIKTYLRAIMGWRKASKNKVKRGNTAIAKQKKTRDKVSSNAKQVNSVRTKDLRTHTKLSEISLDSERVRSPLAEKTCYHGTDGKRRNNVVRNERESRIFSQLQTKRLLTAEVSSETSSHEQSSATGRTISSSRKPKMYDKSLMTEESLESAEFVAAPLLQSRSSNSNRTPAAQRVRRTLPNELDEFPGAVVRGYNEEKPQLVQCLNFYYCGLMANCAESTINTTQCKPSLQTAIEINDGNEGITDGVKPFGRLSPKPTVEVVLDGLLAESRDDIAETKDSFLKQAPDLQPVSRINNVVREVSGLQLHLDDDSEKLQKHEAIRRAELHDADDNISVSSIQIPMTCVPSKDSSEERAYAKGKGRTLFARFRKKIDGSVHTE
jgi:hypothetical protein